MKYKVLTISGNYPNKVQPRNGIFIEHRLRHQINSGRITAKVVSPIPWFPFNSKWFGKYAIFSDVPSSDTRCDIEIHYPRYLVIPKIGMTLSPWILALSLIKPISRLIKSGYDFDIIDAYYLYPDGVAAVWLANYFNKPVIITALGSDINLISQYRLPRAALRWAARRANAITCVSNDLKQKLNAFANVSSKTHVIKHGVDFELFCPPQDRAASRAKLGLTRTTLISVGHLIELKGHHIAIEAMVNLPEFDLIIAGHGPLKHHLQNLAIKLGVSDRVSILGHIDQRQLPEYYGAADAMLLMSSNEGIPNVLLEAMACGTPIIATNVGGIPEIISEPAAGILVKHRTPENLVQAVKELFTLHIDRAATRKFVERFTWEDTTEQHLNLYTDILSKPT